MPLLCLQLLFVRLAKHRREVQRLSQVAEQQLQCRNRYYRQLRLQLRLRQLAEIEPVSASVTRELADDASIVRAADAGREIGTQPPLISYRSEV